MLALLVFPDPAPATTKIGPSVEITALFELNSSFLDILSFSFSK